jgi:lactoylglutathione lyase
MPFSIEHVTLRVRDLEASIDFYQRMFDARVILRRNLKDGKKIVFLKIGDTMLELMSFGPAMEPGDPRERYGVHHIGIQTDDFAGAYQRLKAQGAEFLGEPFYPTEGISLVFLRDPNGAVIELARREPKVFQAAIQKGTVDW